MGKGETAPAALARRFMQQSPGEPVELVLVPGSTADISALRSMDLNVPAGSEIFGDK